MGEMATSFLREVLLSVVTISPEPLDRGGCLTTQNGHIMGGGGGGGVSNTFSYPNVNVFNIIAKNRFQHGTHHNYTMPPRPQHMYDTLSYCPCCTFCILFLFWNLIIWISTLLLQPQNVTHFMFLSLQVHVFGTHTRCWAFEWRGRSSGLHDTGSITGVTPTSVASYPYWSGSGLVTAGVGACNHIVHCR